jgi:putative glutamine amidotransferase
MKQSVKFAFALILFLLLKTGLAQDFLSKGFQENKTYVLLARPTVQNIETIHFLISNKILNIPDIEFIGIYSQAENYDYKQTTSLLSKPEMNRFHLQKLEGEVSPAKIYDNNIWTNTFKKLFDHSVGIIFFGGPDIQPELYKQENLHSVVTDPNRHLFELSFLFHLLGGKQNTGFAPLLESKPGYMVTGFCLGLQSMNVATGGTLTQDIPAQTYKKKNADEIVKMRKDQLHRNYWQEISKDTVLMGINFHPIQFTAHPFFLKTVKAERSVHPLVLSSHHQSIDELGKDLIVTATSMDEKVIEGIHHRIFPNVFAVQFHPEVPALYKEGKKLKFAPEDTPKSFFEILSPADRDFHLKYWETISNAVKSAERLQKMKKARK